MKILKPGKVKQRKFVCKKCGCEFVAGTSDITWHQSEYNKGAVECPCGRLVAWDNGEPYEEPTHAQTDRERLAQLVGETPDVKVLPVARLKITDRLIANGVTFMGGVNMKVVPVVEERFEYEGYPCVILFMPIGHRCGYVGVPKTHPAYQKGCDELNIACHGGLTYAEDYLYNQDDAETWWLGFDCSHAGDAPDIPTSKRYFPEYYEQMEKLGYYHSLQESCPRSMDYAKVNCLKIAAQLRQMAVASHDR